MTARPPEAKPEYSRGPERRTRVSGRSSRARAARGSRSARAASATIRGPIRAGLLVGGLVGAALLLAAEFTTLFEVRTSADATAIRSVSTGSHHSYALIPIALLAAALAYGVWVGASRPALLAIGVLGVIALLISVLGDLPDVSTTGLVTRGDAFVSASSSAGAGMYLETLGATALIVTCVSGFLLIGPPSPQPGRSRDQKR